MNKRGMSQIVTTVIIVVLVLVAIGIVWGVVSNLISDSSEDVSLGKFTINLDIQSAYKDDPNVIVNVKRLAGKGDLTKIKFIISDGLNSESFEEEVTLGELEEQTFTLTPTLAIADVEKVEVAPIYSTGSGADTLGDISDSKTIGENAPDGNGDGGDGGDGSACDPECILPAICIEESCCTPDTCVGAGYQCGTPISGCGGTINCGDCLVPGEVCNLLNYQCEVETSVNTGVVNLAFPTPGIYVLYFDADELPTSVDDYSSYWARFPSDNIGCFNILYHLFPSEGSPYTKSLLRIAPATIATDDTYEIWQTQGGCLNAEP